MAKSNLTPERLRELLHYDPESGFFTWLPYVGKRGRINAGDRAGCETGHKIYIGIDGGIYRAHRLAWLYVHGEWPSLVIDHIDGNPHNNNIKNLSIEWDSSYCNFANWKKFTREIKDFLYFKYFIYAFYFTFVFDDNS